MRVSVPVVAVRAAACLLAASFGVGCSARTPRGQRFIHRAPARSRDRAEAEAEKAAAAPPKLPQVTLEQFIGQIRALSTAVRPRPRGRRADDRGQDPDLDGSTAEPGGDAVGREPPPRGGRLPAARRARRRLRSLQGRAAPRADGRHLVRRPRAGLARLGFPGSGARRRAPRHLLRPVFAHGVQHTGHAAPAVGSDGGGAVGVRGRPAPRSGGAALP